MYRSLTRGFLWAVVLGIFGAGTLSAETIIKLELGSTSPDVIYRDGILSTNNDGVLINSDGDRQTDATFLGFVSDAGIADIAGSASITLDGIEASGDALVFQDVIVNQSTTGGFFKLYDENNALLLEGTLESGILTGPLGTGGSSTGSLFTVSLGKFTGPTETNSQLFDLLDPDSAQLAMSFTNVNNGSGRSGLAIDENKRLLDFQADVTAQIAAESSAIEAPEPAAWSLALFGILGLLGFRRQR